MFDIFDEVETIIEKNQCFDKKLFVIVCQTKIKKLKKYYNRTQNKKQTIYNFVCILNFNQKIKIQINDSKKYETKYKKIQKIIFKILRSRKKIEFFSHFENK